MRYAPRPQWCNNNNMNDIKFQGKTISVLITVLFLAVGACAPINTNADLRFEEKCVEAGRWLDPNTGNRISTQNIIKDAARRKVVLLGEEHSNPDHHAWQVQTIAQIYATNPNIVLGFEAFPRSKQGVLDKWVDGELGENEFIELSGWDEFWRFDKNLYLGLFNFARINHVPMIALNVERELINGVSENGWSGLKETQRRSIGEPAPATSGYLKILEQVFKEHKNGKDENGQTLPTKDNPKFNNFVAAQLTWDRAFAEAIEEKLKSEQTAGKNPVIINIIGRGHIDYGFGVLHQLKSMGVYDVVSFVPWDDKANCDQTKQDGNIVADAIFGTAAFNQFKHPTGPKLGVFIEQGVGGVAVKDVVEKSIAANSGILKGDLIIEAAGKKMASPTDLIKTINAVLPGTWLPLKIIRNNRTIEMVAKFTETNFHGNNKN